MSQLRKSTNDQQKRSVMKNTNSMHKPDIFQQFEQNKKVQKSKLQQIQSQKLGFKLKTQIKPQVKDEDDYADDFDDAEITESAKSNKKNNDLYGIQKNGSQIQKFNTNKYKDQPNTLKLVEKHERSSKSVMEVPQLSSTPSQIGRFEAEIDKRFGLFEVNQMTTDALNRANQQIRDYIRKYNDMLTEILNKNLTEFTSKKKKPATIQQTCKILQQQIKNNKKIQQMDLLELKKLQDHRISLEQHQEQNEGNFDAEVGELQESIKQIKKNIIRIKLEVTNQGKKLVPNDLVFSKPETQSQLAVLKQKLVKARKQFDRNEEKITSLDQRQSQLVFKNGQIFDKDKQATSLKKNQKQNDDKNKKYQQLKKKYDNLKSHLTKSNSLWNTKCSVSNHENDALKTSIKNLELQIKNVQQSTKQAYQKTMKVFNSTKPKNQINKKALQKLFEQMKVYGNNQPNLTKQMSLSHMKLLNAKKQSLNYLHQDENAKIQKKEEIPITKTQQNLQQTKTKSQQSQRSRVWKYQNQDNVKQTDGLHIPNNQHHKLDAINENKSDKQLITKKQLVENKQDKNEDKTQNKPKKFNFNRNKAISSLDQMTKTEAKQDIDDRQGKKQNEIMKQQTRLANINEINLNKKEQTSNFIQTQIKTLAPHQTAQSSLKDLDEEQSIIKPKRLNISLNKNKPRQQSSTYLPFNQVPQNVQKKDQKSQIASNTQANKPVFNLKKKIESEKRKESLILDNQFMAS